MPVKSAGATLQGVPSNESLSKMKRTTSVNASGSGKDRSSLSTAEQIELAVRSWAGPAVPPAAKPKDTKEAKKPPNSARREGHDEKDDVASAKSSPAPPVSPLELSNERPLSPKLSARARSDPKDRYVCRSGAPHVAAP